MRNRKVGFATRVDELQKTGALLINAAAGIKSGRLEKAVAKLAEFVQQNPEAEAKTELSPFDAGIINPGD